MNIGDRVTVAQVSTVVRPLWNAQGTIVDDEGNDINGVRLYYVEFDKPVDVGINWVNPSDPHIEHFLEGLWLAQNQMAGYEE